MYDPLLLNMALQNKQPIIGSDNVKVKDLLLIEEVESAQFVSVDRKSSQMTKFSIFFLL